MTARIKLVYPPKEDNIMIEIQQHNKIDEILRRGVNFWIEGGDPIDYVLINEKEEIENHKTVDEAGIVGGDVIKLVGKARLESVIHDENNTDAPKTDDNIEDFNEEKKFDNTFDKRINLAETWIEENIGVNREDLNIKESDSDQDKLRIVFSDEKNDCFYTVNIENENVTRYIPIYENIEKDET